MSYIIHLKINATGPVQHVLQTVGTQIIAKSALLQYSAVAFDQITQTTADVTDGELIGGHAIKVESTPYSDTIRASMIRVTLED